MFNNGYLKIKLLRCANNYYVMQKKKSLIIIILLLCLHLLNYRIN